MAQTKAAHFLKLLENEPLFIEYVFLEKLDKNYYDWCCDK